MATAGIKVLVTWKALYCEAIESHQDIGKYWKETTTTSGKAIGEKPLVIQYKPTNRNAHGSTGDIAATTYRCGFSTGERV